MAKHQIQITINGQQYRGEIEPRRTLADFLRQDLDLTGTHVGCEHGVCGACTVLLDGVAVRSCLLLAVQANGRKVQTVEGLADPNGELHPIQAAFHKHHALQCGFCTPGFLMSIVDLLKTRPDIQDEEEIREALAGNLCRCTGYSGIVAAVREVAARLRQELPR
ncbi:MAG: (2Fe-2S)-binding protein [Deltaproteobacteria bacterium]|nr:(2Fe-2S)-binding protein [Deltaproteobacteria bacterium]